MKYLIVLVLTLLFQSHVFADNILHCLGAEESYYHKNKVSGAYYRLNSELIGKFIQLSKTLKIKRKFIQNICHNNLTTPSMALLQVLLTHHEKAFYSLATKQDIKQRAADMSTIKEITNMAHYAFTHFIDRLSSQVKKSGCIINKIPELKKLYKKSRYTLEDQGLKKLIHEIKDLEGVFKKLNNKIILKGC